jgi:hypothetical protein
MEIVNEEVLGECNQSLSTSLNMRSMMHANCPSSFGTELLCMNTLHKKTYIIYPGNRNERQRYFKRNTWRGTNKPECHEDDKQLRGSYG